MGAKSHPFHPRILTWSQADSELVPEDFGEDIALFTPPTLLFHSGPVTCPEGCVERKSRKED